MNVNEKKTIVASDSSTSQKYLTILHKNTGWGIENGKTIHYKQFVTHDDQIVTVWDIVKLESWDIVKVWIAKRQYLVWWRYILKVVCSVSYTAKFHWRNSTDWFYNGYFAWVNRTKSDDVDKAINLNDYVKHYI